VLGELGEADRQAVERLLESSAEARALVEELEMATGVIAGALASQPSLVLTPAQRAAVRRAADSHSTRWFAPLQAPWGWAAGAVGVLAVLTLVVALQQGRQSPDRKLVADGSATSTRRAAPGDVAVTGSPGAAPELSIIGGQPAQAAGKQPSAPPAAIPPSPALSAEAGAAKAVITVDTSPAANAADSSTTLSGTVRDGSGAALPGVTVTLAKTTNEIVNRTVTDASGRYTFTNLDAGTAFRVTATLPGFLTASADVRSGGATLQRDFTLAVNALAETITVSGDQPVLQQRSTARLDFAAPPATAPATAAAGRSGRRGGVLNDGVYRLPSLRPPANTESYARLPENGFVRVSQEPLATYSVDVDTASYSNVRRFLTQNRLPPADAVRIEELINYFTYDYPRPSGPHPIGATMAMTAAPWNPRNRLVRIGIKAREIDASRRPSSNLVFLIDVSGSMDMPQKLPLVKSGLKMLVDQLGENDVVSIVVYAGASGLVLPPTHGDQKETIARALDDLQPGGSTNGSAGIRLAYEEAMARFIRGGTNRVILMTDGDFNVGVTSQSDLTRLIEDKAKSGVFLSVLGFGMGNLKDATLEKLADTGNGNYAYIDSLSEARKVLVEQMTGTLVTVAKDVKIQVDFNPAKVEAYRLLGYENRALRPEDFNDDLKDAGDMGAGHTVTALFELVPRGGTVPGPAVDPSVFQPPTARTPAPPASKSNDVLVLRVRYKQPDGATSTRMDVPLTDRSVAFTSADPDFRFAAAVGAFGMLLKESPYRGDATLGWVLDTATSSRGSDRGGYRSEFLALVQKAIALQTPDNATADWRSKRPTK